MPAIDRIKSKYLEQNPVRDPHFVIPPDWVIAVAAVLDEMQREIESLRYRNDEA